MLVRILAPGRLLVQTAAFLPKHVVPEAPGCSQAACAAYLPLPTRDSPSLGCVCVSSADQQRRRQQQSQQQQCQQDVQQQSNQPGSSSGVSGGLLSLDMSGLFTAVHVAKSLGQLEAFRWADGWVGELFDG